MKKKLLRQLTHLRELWYTSRVSKTPLGKYIIVFASSLHIIWAVLLLFDGGSASNATPLRVVVDVFGGPYRTAVVLVASATAAVWFPFLRHTVTTATLALMLVPQQFVLLMSAGNGVRSILRSSYADGVERPWEFIAADQMATILMALLYTIVILEAAFAEPDTRNHEFKEDGSGP